MPLQLLTPPLLVTVRGPDGRLRQALLLGRREDRRFVQVNSGPGDNRLRWVSRDAVLEPPRRVPVRGADLGREHVGGQDLGQLRGQHAPTVAA